MDSLMLMVRVNVTLGYKNIYIWFLKPICFATPKLHSATPFEVATHSLRSPDLDRRAESMQQLKRLNSREMMLPGQQQSSFKSNALRVRAVQTGKWTPAAAVLFPRVAEVTCKSSCSVWHPCLARSMFPTLFIRRFGESNVWSVPWMGSA